MSNDNTPVKEFFSEPNLYYTKEAGNVITEYLEGMVQEEMRAEGLDPLNKEDVKKYWALKGILD